MLWPFAQKDKWTQASAVDDNLCIIVGSSILNSFKKKGGAGTSRREAKMRLIGMQESKDIDNISPQDKFDSHFFSQVWQFLL